MAPRPTALAFPATALALALVLTGCTPESPEPTATPTATGTAAPEPTSTGTPEPEPTEQAPEVYPVAATCQDLVSLDAMYAFNPNFSLIEAWQPAPGSPAAQAEADQGVTCRWQHNSTGETIDLSVASYDRGTLERLANSTYDASTMVPTFGYEGYFRTVGGVGEAVVFTDRYWVVLQSTYFFEPGDAEELVADLLAALA